MPRSQRAPSHRFRVVIVLAASAIAAAFAAAAPAAAAPRNIVLLLSDDHRHDFIGIHPQAPPFLETPSLDRMAARGAWLENAFVTTSLCSPSRASILTGQTMRRHRVIDNQRPVPEGTVTFPEHLRRAGYETAYIGKWHMGHDDDAPRPGFDHWASFRGQGEYFDPELNINGERRRFEGYTTDILAAQAVEWLRRERERPFCLYVGFKAVHFPFEPAPRHRGRYDKAAIPYPETMANTEENYRTQPRWVRERRYGIHGIDHMETGRFDNDPVPSFDDLYRRYAETVHGLDENVGRILDAIDAAGLGATTLVLYMGDNGFALGEHGFYDKRDAFEESIRVPLLALAPGLIAPGTRIRRMVLNIDIAPTLLDLAGVAPPASARFQGRSFLPLLRGESPPWREHFVYEYTWEWNFPSTPTIFAIRTERHKYAYYHGVWDIDSLHDLETDPHERHNLISVPAYRDLAENLRRRLFDELEADGDIELPVLRPIGERLDARKLGR